MIIKSFLIEQNISNLTNNIVLLYGENLGLKLDLKDKIQKSFKNSDCFNTSQDTILKNDEYFFEQINNHTNDDSSKSTEIIFQETSQTTQEKNDHDEPDTFSDESGEVLNNHNFVNDCDSLFEIKEINI